MNPRQRRAVLLLALAVAGLVGVFALVANYVSDVETEVGDKIFVLELTKPATANEAITDDMVTLKTATFDVIHRDGGILPPEAPGLGIEVNEEVLGDPVAAWGN